MRQVSAAIELVLFVILAAGGLVLIAGVQASVDARMQESAILRAVGAKRSLILGGLLSMYQVPGLRGTVKHQQQFSRFQLAAQIAHLFFQGQLPLTVVCTVAAGELFQQGLKHMLIQSGHWHFYVI